jgi:hypothetical protein
VVVAVTVAETLTGLEVGFTFIFTPVFVNLHSPFIIYILTLVLSLNIILWSFPSTLAGLALEERDNCFNPLVKMMWKYC